MKTEHEIRLAAKSYIDINDSFEDFGNAKIAHDAFIAGAIFANPKWIEVNDEQPKRGQLVLFICDSTVVLSGIYFDNKFYSGGINYKSKYWMPTPQLL